jgi:hypothetical protein
MSFEGIINRAPRSTRAGITAAERHQVLVISALINTGHPEIARRLARCQRDRQRRASGWPWRYGSPGCWACRRTVMRRWWRGFQQWLGDKSDASLAVLPIDGDLLVGTHRLRKGLRDVRDRMARQDERWPGVALAGLVANRVAIVMIKHPGIDRADVWWTMSARWPQIVLVEIDDAQPSSVMLVEDAVTVAVCRRGIQPLRIVVLEQVAVEQPMPAIF